MKTRSFSQIHSSVNKISINHLIHQTRENIYANQQRNCQTSTAEGFLRSYSVGSNHSVSQYNRITNTEQQIQIKTYNKSCHREWVSKCEV